MQPAAPDTPKQVPTRSESERRAGGRFAPSQRDEDIVVLEGDPPGGSEGKARVFVPIGVPESLFDERFSITQDINLDVSVVECARTHASALERMLKQWDTPFVRVDADHF